MIKGSSYIVKRIMLWAAVSVLALSCAGCGASSDRDESEREEVVASDTEEDDASDESEEELFFESEEEKVSSEETESTTEEEESSEEETAVWIDVLDDGAQLYVCTPPEYVILQNAPGKEEENGQTRLYPGTYLKWYGEQETVEKKDYIRVTVLDTGEEGWIEFLYAVRVGYDPDVSVLDVVETDDPLYTYEMMVSDIDTLCGRYPEILHKNVIGQSVTGRSLYEVVLGNPDAKHHVMVQATIHGREYVNTQLIMKLLEYYAYYYDKGVYGNVRYADLFDNTAFHVVTMANPDGVVISQSGVDALENDDISQTVRDAYERDKGTLVYEENSNGDLNWMDYYRDPTFTRESNPNASRMITYEEYQTIWKANANGVDLNNNFDAAWADIDLKWAPSYGSFKGYSAVSEPESQALAAMAVSRDYECYLSYHSTGQLIYYDCEGNSAAMSGIEEDFAKFMREHIHHKISNNKSAYNVNLGGFGDWIQLSLNKPSLTIESGRKPCPLPINEFSAIWLRHRESWAALAGEYY